MIPPTLEQAATLTAIRRLTRNGVPPSLRELADELGLRSIGNLQDRLARMKDRGLIVFEPRRARSLRIVEGAESVDLSLLSGEQLVKLQDRVIAELIRRTP